MSARTSTQTGEKFVPLSLVFLVVGFIILLTVVTIWLLSPDLMPRPVFTLIQKIAPETAVLQSNAAIPTPASLAAAPEANGAVALLPETPAQTGEELPSYFVSAAEAAKRQPFVGEPVRIVVPRLGLDAPVREIGLSEIKSDGQTYYQWQVPNDFRAGWHYNSARLGETGNTVLNGHHNIYGEVFRDLIDLNEGDVIFLYDFQKSYEYRVTTKEILAERGQPLSVRIENARWIAPTEDERITLITCWPYTDNSHRLVIVAEPVMDDS